jgi:hypothetical protein
MAGWKEGKNGRIKDGRILRLLRKGTKDAGIIKEGRKEGYIKEGRKDVSRKEGRKNTSRK